MKVDNDIISILAAGTTEGNIYYLPPGQLERKTYVAVNKCLENLGGKWDRRAKGHIFDHDPEDALSNLILTGETENPKKVYQFFPTPKELAEQLCDMAELTENSNVLEPSCGSGDLSDVVYERCSMVFGVELNKDMGKYFVNKPYPVLIGTDFLRFAGAVQDGRIDQHWNRVIMNPPFSKQQDITHIYAAWTVLRKGILVSVTSPSPFIRENKKSIEFRNFLKNNNAEVSDVPEGIFKKSGTMIRTKIVKIRKH